MSFIPVSELPLVQSFSPVRKSNVDKGTDIARDATVSRIENQYDILPTPCRKLTVTPFLTLITFSRISAFDLRQAIRKTWGSIATTVCGVRLLFIVGKTYDRMSQMRVRAEASLYEDIIQSNQFEDVYRSAAQKALALLQWANTYCPESTYTSKIDDDNWLNLPEYLKFLHQHETEDFLYGALYEEGTPVSRSVGNKYYVPREEFPFDKYPEYLSGVLYAVPTRHIPKLLSASFEISRTFNDDVYVCGLMATKANLTRNAVPMYAWSLADAHRRSACPKRDVMCVHYSSAADLYLLWSDKCARYTELC